MSDKESILGILSPLSQTIVDRINNDNTCSYFLDSKEITHSDLKGNGKRVSITDPLDKNILYYLTVEEMILKNESKTARQTDLIIPSTIYNEIGFIKGKGRKLSDAADVFLVNDSLRYFTPEYTSQIIKQLNKQCPWKAQNTFSADEGDYTQLSVTYANQGVGKAEDTKLQLFRNNVFLGDVLHYLVEKKQGQKPVLFIIAEKNAKFFDILGLDPVKTWELELIKWQKKYEELKNSGKDDKTIQAKERLLQSAWKKLLAQEIIRVFDHGNNVICPFTRIIANYTKTPMLFIASHIKSYSDSNILEKYDAFNGLLLSANADALFDKHMITVSEDKELLFSCLLQDDKKLIDDLKLNKDIYKEILNDQRMKFMEDHRRIFFEEEKKRQKEDYSYGEETEGSVVAESEDTSNESPIIPMAPLSYDYEDNIPEKKVAELLAPIVVEQTELSKSCKVSKNEEVLLISNYKSIKHLKWIIRNNTYIVEIGEVGKSVPKTPIAQKVLLYDIADPNTTRYFNVIGCETVNGSDLLDSDALYLEDSFIYQRYKLQKYSDVCVFDVPQIIEEVSSSFDNKENSPIIIIPE